MSAIATFDRTLSASDLTARYPNAIPVLCVSAGSKKATTQALLLPQGATVAALAAALQETLGTKKTVQVFLDGAAPSKDAALSDLCVDGSVHVTFSVEGKYGAGATGTAACSGGGGYE